MRLRHPFEWLSHPVQKRALILLVLFMLVVMIGLQTLGRPLKTDHAPLGIVSFEFAGDLAKAHNMVESWDKKGRIYAGLNLGLDYLFIVVYVSVIGLGCVLMGQRLSGQVGYPGIWAIMLAWGQLAAGLFDSMENYALIQILLGSERTLWPAMARWCAAPKFLLVAAGLVYIVIAAILLVIKKSTNPRVHS